MKSQTRNVIRALLHGMTGAGLFRRLDYPGAPNVFIDPRSLDEVTASGEFSQTIRRYRVEEDKTAGRGEPAGAR